MAVDIDYKIELKTVKDHTSMQPVFEVWFTDSGHEKWRVSKPVRFDRALELLAFVQEMYWNHQDGVLLPEEFHIVGRYEAKLT